MKNHRNSGRGPRSSGTRQNTPNHGSSITAPKGGRLVIGFHALRELLKVNPRSIQKLILQNGFESNNELRELEEEYRRNNKTIEIRPEVHLSKLGNHQGAVAVVGETPELDLANLPEGPCVLLAIDGVEDPHNLGAMLRTSWLMNVSGVILAADRSVHLTPSVHKVASGGVEHVPTLAVSQFGPTFADLKEKGFWIFGLCAEGPKTIFDLQLPERVVWVLGAEDKGLRVNTERACDELVSIPQASSEASFNVSVTAGMALLESRRQSLKPQV